MNIFDRLGNGWDIAMASFKILRKKKDLIIFPVLSGVSIMLVVVSFFMGIFGTNVFSGEGIENFNTPLNYFLLLIFYVVNYFIVVFFNMALIHCTRLYFQGEEVTLRAGLKFSMSRIGVIFSWSLFTGTIGLLIRVIQENVGIVGQIITSIVGIVWSIATFFVVPVIAYENVGPLEAVKRSTKMMKEKWGESLGANFSLGLIQFVGMIVVGLPMYLIGATMSPVFGIALALIGVFLVISIISAAQTIFISAIYHNINGDLDKHFDQQMIDNLFEKKSKGWLN